MGAKKINIIFIIITLFLLGSCVKEPNVMTVESYEKQKAKMYYFYNDNEEIIYPQIMSSTINDSIIVISAVYENNDEDNISSFKFTVVTENLNVGTTTFTNNNNSWATSIVSNYYTGHTQAHNNSDGYLNISEIDKVNNTVSGEFDFLSFNGKFNKLSYKDSFDEYFISNTAKVSLYDNTDNLNLSGNYAASFVTYSGTNSVGIYFDNMRLSISPSTYPGSFDFENTYMYLYTDYKNSDNKYTHPQGTYTVSDTIINNHDYRKIIIDAHFAYLDDDDYYNENNVILHINSEILIYKLI